MTYVDGFVLVVPKSRVKEYKAMASRASKVWKKHGALHYFECKGDDMKPKWVTFTFPKMAKAKPSETVWFSFIVYKNKAHRNAVNKKVMADPALQADMEKNKKMPFDMKRMAYGGFTTQVQA
jgi:uncharacterized protein YbaA (DUF1428 family)